MSHRRVKELDRHAREYTNDKDVQQGVKEGAYWMLSEIDHIVGGFSEYQLNRLSIRIDILEYIQWKEREKIMEERTDVGMS